MGLPAKRFNEETIDALTLFLELGGEAELSDKHKEILERIRYADEILRQQRHKREEVATFIKNKFGISRDTAYRDIVIAEKVFSSSTPLNKKYEVQLRIELLKKQINNCYTDKDVFNAAQLEKVLQKYYDMYPDYKEPRSPKNITFVINGGIHQTNNNLTLAQAEAKTDDLIKLLEEKDDY